MTSELRNTGITVVGEMPWGTHFCSFYETKQDLLDILIPYFKSGLENDEFCLWIVSNSELLKVQEARNALQEVMPDLERYVAERSIEVVGHDDWFLNEGTFDFHRVANRFKEKLHEALARGYTGMRVNGSPAWLQTRNAKALRKFEKEVDQLFPTERIIASCTYPIKRSRADFLLDVARNHQFAIARRHGNWDIVETPKLIKAKAEIDRLNVELEQRVKERTKKLEETTERLRGEITERKRAEEAVRKSEDRLRLVIDTIPIMAWSVRPDGVVDFLNQRWMDFSGLSLEQYLEEPTRPIHPEDTSRVLEKWLVAMAARESYEDEMRLRGADGEYRWFLVRTAPLRDEQGNLVEWYGVSIDIEDRKRAENRLRATTEQLRALSASLRSSREEEAIRIARELHDELGARLSSLRWDLEEVVEVVSEATDLSDAPQLTGLRKRIEAMIELTDTTVSAVRRIASELRPTALDELGLCEAIELQARQFQERTGIIVKCDCALENVDLSRERSTAVFRISQEALTNILRHARATMVNIQMMKKGSELIFVIRDNGRGITEDEKSGQRSLGLLGMRERAHLIGGKLEIVGSEGQGTIVTLRISASG
jgi:two-component system sensor histidine kinase UhpB